jgi:hypothetical protein
VLFIKLSVSWSRLVHKFFPNFILICRCSSQSLSSTEGYFTHNTTACVHVPYFCGVSGVPKEMICVACAPVTIMSDMIPVISLFQGR